MPQPESKIWQLNCAAESMSSSSNGNRKRYNPKRQIRMDCGSSELAWLASSIRYTGNPEHKRNPGDFHLNPPAQPRADSTLCDGVGIFQREEAQRLLKDGVAKGLISEQTRGSFPQNIWAVTKDGYPVEAQLENRVQGTYHGYPMTMEDDFRFEVLKRWNAQ